MPELTEADFIPFGSPNNKDNTIPRFYPREVLNNFKSEKEGHPVYDKMDYVEVLIPGDRLTQADRKVTDKDKARWARHWAAYQAGKELTLDGMPLEKWPLVDKNQIEHLKHFNIRSVEQLAKLSDTQLQAVGMGARALRDKAVVYLEEARGSAGISRVLQENRDLQNQLAAMRTQVDSLLAIANAAKEAAAAAPAPVAVAAPAVDQAAIAAMVAAAVRDALTSGATVALADSARAQSFVARADEALAKPPAAAPKPAIEEPGI